jgi:hypothetical protein
VASINDWSEKDDEKDKQPRTILHTTAPRWPIDFFLEKTILERSRPMPFSANPKAG